MPPVNRPCYLATVSDPFRDSAVTITGKKRLVVAAANKFLAACSDLTLVTFSNAANPEKEIGRLTKRMSVMTKAVGR